MSVHNDSFMYEKSFCSGIVYLSADSQPDLCFYFSKEVKLRIVFDNAGESDIATQYNCTSSEINTVEEHVTINEEELKEAETVSHELSVGQEDPGNILSHFRESDVEGEILTSLCSVQPDCRVVVNIKKPDVYSEDSPNVHAGMESNEDGALENVDTKPCEEEKFQIALDSVDMSEPKIRTISTLCADFLRSGKQTATVKLSPEEALSAYQNSNKLSNPEEDTEPYVETYEVEAYEDTGDYPASGWFLCEICSNTFTCKEAFDSHIMADAGSHECNLCQQTFPYEGYLLAHISVYHKDSPMDTSVEVDIQKRKMNYSCHLCGHRGKDMYDLRRHMCTHSQDYYYKCCICGKKLKSRNDRFHMAKEHGRDLIIAEEETRVKQMTALSRNQILFGNQSRKAEIKRSQGQIPRMAETNAGIRKKDWGNCDLFVTHEKGFACKICKTNFVTKDQFRSHMRADGGSHTCTVCQQVFPYKAFLLAHIGMEHMLKDQVIESETSKQKKTRCQFCTFTGISMYDLRKHMIVHTKEDFFKCCVCGETAKEIKPLRVHIAYHMNYNCDGSRSGVMQDSSSMLNMSESGEDRNGKKDYDLGDRSDEEQSGTQPIYDISSDLMVAQCSSRVIQCKFCKELFNNKRLYDMHAMAKTSKHKCDDCSVLLPTKAYLYAHISVMHTPLKKTKFSCHICELVTKNIMELRTHMITHTDEYSFKCCICGEVLKRRKTLIRHMKKHENYFTSRALMSRALKNETKQSNQNVECGFCSKVFKSMEVFDEHFRPEAESHKCEMCEQSFLHKNDALVHISLDHHLGHENRQPKCHLCGEQCTFSRLIHHMASHTGEPVYKCCICGKSMNSKTDSKHMRLHRKGGMIKCSCCNQLFSSMGEIFKHRNSVNGIKCSLCGETFPNRTSRNVHYQMVHPDEILRCSKCDRIFSAQEELSQHMKYHATQNKKQCPVCGKLFSVMKLHLLTHKSSVDDSEMYHCDQCPKKFTRNSAFQYHKMTHNKVPLFKCHLCTRTFMTNSSYRKHLKTHMTFKPHVCQVCGKRFYERSRLNAHTAVHSKVRLNICTVCNRKFTSKHMLSAHMKAIHSVDLEEFEKQGNEQTLQSADIREISVSEVVGEDLTYEEINAAAATLEYVTSSV